MGLFDDFLTESNDYEAIKADIARETKALKLDINMFDITFVTDDKTEYKISFSYTYSDDPGDRGVWPRIERINESPSGAHHVEIMNDWNRGDLFNRACELAYLDMESKCVK